jgi:epoxyqueuosine reductase QueG
MFDTLAALMCELAQNSPANSFGGEYRFYEPPLIAVASASDPLFAEMKSPQAVGPMFMLPREWLPGAATVISYFLPFTLKIRRSNRSLGPASPEWLHARFPGEEFNNLMRRFIISETEKAGGRALAPVINPGFVSDFEIYTSNWSERHVAFIAGLGTFGLNRGLITKKGMAGRFGSVITDLKLPVTRRPYDSPFQYCPFLSDGSCGACIDRCPTAAITPSGKDKAACHQYLFFTNPMKAFNEPFGYPHSACGKCQTAVPCEDMIP